MPSGMSSCVTWNPDIRPILADGVEDVAPAIATPRNGGGGSRVGSDIVRRRIAIAAVLASLVGAAVASSTTASTGVPTRAFTWPACDGFDYPVGPPDADGYYDAQPFGENDHLGSDWNGNGGGDSDRGDPVHSIANGRVVFAADLGGGWGNVVRVVHACDDGMVESIYAHLATIDVAAGTRVRRGDIVGTIGDADGQYVAHLHLELRTVAGLPIGGGYGRDTSAHLDPTAFISRHRPADRTTRSRAETSST